MALLIPIDDPEDPRLDGYRALKEAELSSRQGLFVIEGAKVLALAISARAYRIRSVLLLAPRLEELRPSLAEMPEGTPIYVASPAVLERVAGFSVHRGVLALGERGEASPPARLLAALEAPSTLFVGLGLSNHDNVGALYRNAAALGARVLLDDRSADPLYRKAIRVSMGHAIAAPPVARVPAAALLDALAAAGFARWALTPRATADPLDLSCRPPPRLALLLGAEGEGLPEEILTRADRALRLPMAAEVDSLNVATAAAIAGYLVRALRAG